MREDIIRLKEDIRETKGNSNAPRTSWGNQLEEALKRLRDNCRMALRVCFSNRAKFALFEAEPVSNMVSSL